MCGDGTSKWHSALKARRMVITVVERVRVAIGWRCDTRISPDGVKDDSKDGLGEIRDKHVSQGCLGTCHGLYPRGGGAKNAKEKRKAAPGVIHASLLFLLQNSSSQ